jgi:hypothetical protein
MRTTQAKHYDFTEYFEVTTPYTMWSGGTALCIWTVTPTAFDNEGRHSYFAIPSDMRVIPFYWFNELDSADLIRPDFTTIMNGNPTSGPGSFLAERDTEGVMNLLGQSWGLGYVAGGCM